MIIGTWRGVAIAGLLAASCASQQKQGPPPSAAQQAQRTSEQAAQQAARADQELAQARQRLAQAQEMAAQTQQRIANEQANVQRLDAAARAQHQAALASAEEAAAANEVAQGLRSASGRIVQVTPSRVVLDGDGGGKMQFDLDPRTRVLVGGEQRSIAELQQGADARVAYDPSGPAPTAVTIHVAPAGTRRTPAQAAQ